MQLGTDNIFDDACTNPVVAVRVLGLALMEYLHRGRRGEQRHAQLFGHIQRDGQVLVHRAHGDPSNPEILKQPASATLGILSVQQTITLFSIVSVFVIWVVLQQPNGVGVMLPLVAGLFLAWFVWLLATQCNSEERGKMSALFFLIVVSTVFWSMFEQSGGSMTLFADRATDLTLFGTQLTAAQFGSANAIFIILLSPLFALLWPALLSHNIEPSSPAKFGFGIIQVGQKN